MEKIIVTAKFHTGHRQLGYPGKCKFVHGHTWQAKVVVTAEEFPRDDLDMSLDFGDIKNVIRFMDHKMLITEQDLSRRGVVRAGGRGAVEGQRAERRKRCAIRV
jgi:6-pyruvoyltetrahydropterin/6-carboxytetrahydropterin synthase